MNILFLTDLYPLSKEDNTSSALKDFVENFRSLGHNVQVIRPNFLLNSYIRKKKFFKTGYFNNAFNANYITPFWFDVKKKIPYIEKYDIIVSHMPSGNIFAEKFKGKLICGVHISDLKVLTEPIYSIYFKQKLLKTFRRAEKLVCRSPHIEEKLLKIYPEFKNKTIVINSGIDENLIIKREPNFNEKIKVLSVANLIKRKNIDKLIQACKSLENIELTIIGDGEERKHLEKIDKNVIFKGHLEKEKVLEEMRNSDIFILPSVNETLGLVYLEALASGCITVGTINDGTSGIIKDEENGFLTKPTVKDIKNTLEKIISYNKENLNKIAEQAYFTIKNNTSKACTLKYIQTIINAL